MWETNRTFTVGYCLADYAFTAAYVGLLVKFRRKYELILGLVAGACMLVAELILSSIGVREVSSPPFFPPVLVLMAIGFDPTLVFISAAYSLLGSLLGAFPPEERKHAKITLSFAIVGWFVYPSAMFFSTGWLGETITIRRAWPWWVHLIEALLTIVFAVLTALSGYGKEALKAFCGGTFLDACFEGGMLLYGVRWYVGPAWLKFALHVFFELNAGVMVALFWAAKSGLLSYQR